MQAACAQKNDFYLRLLCFFMGRVACKPPLQPLLFGYMKEKAMPVTLQRYTRADKPETLRRIALFFGGISGKTARANLREWRRKPNELYVIQRDGAQAGFLCLGFRGSNVAWINYIYVDEGLRGQGIASAAIAAAEGIVRARKGYDALCMDVDPRNGDALRLYHRLGYDTLSMVTVRRNFGGSGKDQETNLLGLDFRY